MSGSFEKAVVVIDAMSFRRARDECFLAPWAKQEGVELISVRLDEVHAKLVEDFECGMLIYDVGGGSPSSREIVAEIQILRTLRPIAALVILTDDDSLESVISAINAGVQGYFSNAMPPALALQALSFVLHGGTYFPPNAITHGPPGSGISRHGGGGHQKVSDQAQSDTIPEEQSPGIQPGNGSMNISKAESLVVTPDFAPKASSPQLTERQECVLECLCQGDPNKVIGRKLGMTETTVKVHVREIMRKLGVANRTQVALAAGPNGRGSGREVSLQHSQIATVGAVSLRSPRSPH
jgi:DNA-binding NarL/FixJ family response regulator